MQVLTQLDVQALLDSFGDGVYVCDLQRRIIYWSRSAERITGWQSGEVLGRACHEGILCHIDTEGRALCGEDYCPLYRAMLTRKASKQDLIVYAASRDGRRMPLQVSVSPLYGPEGKVIGGIEVFRDATNLMRDMERARAIQHSVLCSGLPHDASIAFAAYYTPHDVIGGDYCNVHRFDANTFGFMLADVMGHGVAAALYTMLLSAMWERHHQSLVDPPRFLSELSDELGRVVMAGSFATAVCGLVDSTKHELRFAGAGGPPMLLTRSDGAHQWLDACGLPLGLIGGARYHATCVPFSPGDRLLVFSDGAVEVVDAEGKVLGQEGLLEILIAAGYPEQGLQMPIVQRGLLKASNAIRLEDDVTFLEVCFKGSSPA